MSFIERDGVVDLDMLDRAIESGHVRSVAHPNWPDITINTYTQRCVVEEAWNEVTLACRGLIVDRRDASIVARGPAKFFNWHEGFAPVPGGKTFVEAYDKLDGSLIILFRNPLGKWVAASKGSFTSDQALAATALLLEKYTGWLANLPNTDGLSLVFELVGPSNRIVLQYPEDDLVLLGVVNNPTARWMPGATIAGPLKWPGLVAEPIWSGQAKDLTEIESRPDAEGVVIFIPGNGGGEQLIKVKEPRYVALHKIVTGISERSVWEHLSGYADGKFGEPGQIEDLLERIPDELHPWARLVAEDLGNQWRAVTERFLAAYDRVAKEMRERGWSGRPQFAQLAKGSADFRYLMLLLDTTDDTRHAVAAKRISETIWKEIKPEGGSAWSKGMAA